MNILKNLIKIKNNKRAYLRYYKETYGLSLMKHQLDLIESKDEIIEISFPRQFGGTTALLIKAIEYAINNQMSEVMILGNSKIQMNYAFEAAKGFIERNTISRYILRITKNPHNIDFINGSKISFVSSKAIESVRGRKVDCLIVDGRRYISDDEFDCACACTCKNPNRQIVILN